MVRRLAIFSLILIAFSNCAKNNDTTSNDGSCSQSFVDDANAISIARMNFTPTAEKLKQNKVLTSALALELKEKLTSVKNACENFKSRHAGVSCRLMKNDREAFISSSEFDEVCGRVKAALETELTPYTASAEFSSTPRYISAAPSPYPVLNGINGIKIKETTSDYKIVVLDYKTFLSLANRNEILVEQGKVYDPVSSGPYQYHLSSEQKIICDVTTEEPNSQKSELNPNPSPESNPVLSVMDYSETVVDVDDDSGSKQSRFLELSFNETSLKIYCMKDEPKTEYTWSELQNTFSKIIEIKKNEPDARISAGTTKTDSF
jgi:hypothetical protein